MTVGIGIATDEFGVAGEDKPVHYFTGGGPSISFGGVAEDPRRFGPANMRPSTELWNDENTLSKYDMAILSCECSENLSNKSMAAFTSVTNYLSKGGRIFGSHFSYVWLKNATDPTLTRAISIGGGTPLGAMSPMTIDTSFPTGKALADWMKFLDPMITYGQISANQVFSNVQSVMAASGLSWASSAGRTGGMPAPRVVTANTPAGVPADKQCGRAAHLDAHIALVGNNSGMPPRGGAGNMKLFPESCGTSLSKGEEALAFLFFDLASCIRDETTPIEPPIVVP